MVFPLLRCRPNNGEAYVEIPDTEAEAEDEARVL
jgi:hypothetical protein